MASNLRDRLKIIREHKSTEKKEKKSSFDISALLDNGWESSGYQVLKKEILLNVCFSSVRNIPVSLGIVVPDLAGLNPPEYEDFLFFDLETTGLSGGAGTVAFIAAFGQFITANSAVKLHVTQFLLLDYPGEVDFLNAVIKKIKNGNPVIVTYNGKCFDSQILKTRCLMNGIKPPEYRHADLLHPARRLWKNIIKDCSQSSVEANILGLSREDDIPGALAPEIWFEFLKNGKTERLIGICEHNCSDIAGLSSILAAMISIANVPIENEYKYDIERLALYWLKFIRHQEKTSVNEYDNLLKIGNELLFLAMKKNYPRASFVYAKEQLLNGNSVEGRKRLLNIINSSFPENIKAAALRCLSIDSERRLKDANAALEFAKMGLNLKGAGNTWRIEFERRVRRLEKKCH